MAERSLAQVHIVELTHHLPRWRVWNILDVSHPNRAPLPGEQDLLHSLTKNPMPRGYAAAIPSEKKIELHHLSLQIGLIVLCEDGYLRREADSVLTNLPPKFRQGKVLKASGALDPRLCLSQVMGLTVNGSFCGRSDKEGIQTLQERRRGQSEELVYLVGQVTNLQPIISRPRARRRLSFRNILLSLVAAN